MSATAKVWLIPSANDIVYLALREPNLVSDKHGRRWEVPGGVLGSLFNEDLAGSLGDHACEYTLIDADELARLRALESERKALHDLCGEMLATLRANVMRGSVRTEPADKTPELEALLEQFRARWMAVGMPEARDGRGE